MSVGHIVTLRNGGVSRIYLGRHLLAAGRRELVRRARAELDAGCRDLLLHCDGCDFMDSSAMDGLGGVARLAAAAGAVVTLVDAGDPLLAQLHAHGVLPLVSLRQTSRDRSAA